MHLVTGAPVDVLPFGFDALRQSVNSHNLERFVREWSTRLGAGLLLPIGDF